MKTRPLFAYALSLLSGIILGKNLGLEITGSIIPFVISGIVLPVLFSGKKAKSISLALSCLLLVLLGMLSFAPPEKNASPGDSSELTARVKSTEEGFYYNRVELEALTINSEKHKAGIILNTKASLLRDDIISFSAVLKTPDRARNTGSFDDYLYCASKGISFRTRCDNIKKIGRASDLLAFMNSIRSSCGDFIGKLYPENAGLAKALLFGIEEDLSQDTLELYSAAGMTHIIVISGQHISLLASIAGFIAAKLRFSRTPRLLFILLTLFLFSFFTDFSPSTMRAVISCSYNAVGEYFGKKTDSLTGLSLAFIVLFACNPMSVFSLGFQLSFGISFALICASKYLNKLNPAASAFMSSLIAALASGILLLNSSFEFNPFLVILNALLVPVMAIVVPLLAASCLLSALFGSALAWFTWLPNIFIRVMNRLAVLFAGIAPIPLAGVSTLIIIGFFALVYLFSSFNRTKTKLKLSISFVIVSLALIFSLKIPNYDLKISFIDCGDASSCIISSGSGTDVMIDCAEKEIAYSYVMRNGISLDAAIITHAHMDHAGDAAKLISSSSLKALFTSPSAKDLLKKDFNIEANILLPRDIIDLGSGAELIILRSPESPSKDANRDSMFILLRYMGENICLFTGDAYMADENDTISAPLKTRILVLGHHGSETSASASFLANISPEYAVISSGQASAREDLSGLNILNTSDLGEITFIIKDGELNVSSALGGS